MPDTSRYIPTKDGFLMVLEQDDVVFDHLNRLMETEDVGAATFTGFGFVKTVTFGFFDFDRREYDPRTFTRCELANMTGSLAWKDDAPSIHAHGVACDSTFACYGGHLLSLEVGTGSLEIAIVRIAPKNRRLVRTVEPAFGANVLRVHGAPGE
jgi:predicted DNA-binding protein with PD1-like motif